MSNKIRFDAELNDGVSKKLNGISKAFDRLGGPGSGASLFGNVGAKAVAVGFGLIQTAASKSIGFVFDSIDAFSQLEQSAGAIDAVFGKSARVIEDFAETAAEKAGLSKRAVFEMASVLGASLQGMGFDVDAAARKAIQLEQIGADLAATFGGPTVDAVQAIGSALRGERDPIERFGISIKEADVQARILQLGLANTTAEEKKMASATATLDLIIQGASLTTGRFAAETDTLAGKQAIANAKMEDAQAVLGEKLAPLMEDFTQFMIDVGIPALEGTAAVFGAIGDGVGVLNDKMRTLFGWQQKMVNVHPAKGTLQEWVNQQNQNLSGKLGSLAFAEGGMVPGPVGAPQVAVVHGGEQVLTPRQQRISGGSGHGHPIILDGRQVANAVDARLYRTYTREPAGFDP